MSKVNEAIFTILPIGGKLELSSKDDLYKYCIENEGIPQTMTLKPLSKSTEKERMYAYLFGPVLACAIDGLTSAGYTGIDKVSARYLLEAEFCKFEVYSPKTGKTKVYTKGVATMNNKELLKFIVDVLFFLETELQQTVPDTEAWKMKLRSGKDFKRVK